MQAFSNDGLRKQPGHYVCVQTNNPGQVGEEIEILDTHKQVLNVATITSVQPNGPHWKKQFSVQATVIA